MTSDLTTRAVAIRVIHEANAAHNWVAALTCYCGLHFSNVYKLIDHLDGAILDALLAAHTNCETCAGTGQTPSADQPWRQKAWQIRLGPCPTCNGSGRGDRLLVAILMEPVTVENIAQTIVTGRDFYIERPVDQQEET